MITSNIFSLEGKTVIVTGAAGLIGQMQCKALSDFGATVVVGDIEIEEAEKIASGDINFEIKVNSEKDILSKSLVKLIEIILPYYKIIFKIFFSRSRLLRAFR